MNWKVVRTGCIIKMLDYVMLDRAFGNNEDNGIKRVENVDILSIDICSNYFHYRVFFRFCELALEPRSNKIS